MLGVSAWKTILTFVTGACPRESLCASLHEGCQPKCQPHRFRSSHAFHKPRPRQHSKPFHCHVRRVCWHGPFPILCTIRRTSRKQYTFIRRPDSSGSREQPSATAVHRTMLWLLTCCQCLGFLQNQWWFVQSSRK